MKGHVIGRYRVIRKLGTGGMAEVYLARHELMDRYAALKLLLPEMSVREGIVRRFFQEAQAAARIDHPGIAHVFDVGHAPDGRAFLAMEVLSGESLGRRLRRQKKLSLPRAVTLIRQLAGVIGAAHKHGIIHRDLKPDNLFLVPDPEMPYGERVKVLDFGLAKLLDGALPGAEMTAQGAVFGTPAYMAPEQCESAASVDARTDLYAIGCLFYACLRGRPPFGTGGIEVLVAQVGRAPVPLRARMPSIPREIDALVLRLLAKDPEARVPSCDALICELDRAVAAAPELARRMRNVGATPGAEQAVTIRNFRTIKGTVACIAELERGARSSMERDTCEDSRAPWAESRAPSGLPSVRTSGPCSSAAQPAVEPPSVYTPASASVAETRRLRARAPAPVAPLRQSLGPVQQPLRQSLGPVQQPLQQSLGPVQQPLRPSLAPEPRPAGEGDARRTPKGSSPTIGNGELDLALERESARRVLWSLMTTGFLGGLVGLAFVVSPGEEQSESLVSPVRRLAAEVDGGVPADAQQAPGAGAVVLAPPPAAALDELVAQAEREVSAEDWGAARATLSRASEHEDMDEPRYARARELARRVLVGEARAAGQEGPAQGDAEPRGGDRAGTSAGKREPGGSGRKLLADIKSAYRGGAIALAFERCQEAPARAARGEELARFCGFVACKLRKPQAARRYYARVTEQQNKAGIAQTCLEAGFDIQD